MSPDPEVGRKAVGFFEESAGVRSSSRLLAMLLWVLTAGIAVCTCVYLLRTKPPDAGMLTCKVLLDSKPSDAIVLACIDLLKSKSLDSGVLASVAAIITALGGWGALIQVKRNNGGGDAAG